MKNKDLTNILKYCKEKEFYFGEGNPDGEILFIGQEIGYGDTIEKTPALDAIYSRAQSEVEKNLSNWEKHCQLGIGQYLEHMKNLFQEKTNPTWLNYQKVVNSVIGREISEEHFDFLNCSFITEFSQLPLPKSSYLPKEKRREFAEIKRKSIENRRLLFDEKKSFFRRFPIVIMACGHYPKIYDFDILDFFDVEFTEDSSENPNEELIIKRSQSKYWYHIHYNKDYKEKGKDRILIHTRQLSNFFDNKENTENFLSEIGELCNPFYK